MSTPGISVLDGKYMITMDLYPQESKEFNQVYSFYEYLKEGRFTTTRCKDCGTEPFPPRIMCPECYGTNMEWVDWPTEGTVIELTEELVGVPLGFGRAPLIHALVDLQGKCTLFVRIANCNEGQLKAGDKVKLFVFDVESVPQETGREVVEISRVCYAFEPVK
jgi:uncharacterized OB-fold protein